MGERQYGASDGAVLEERGQAALGTDMAPGLPVFGPAQQRWFDASPDAMRITEHGSWRYLAVNDAALELYGYAREEFLRLTLHDTRHPEERAEQDATLGTQTAFLRHSGIRRHVRKSGDILFVEVIAQDILFEGRPARLGVTVDATGRLRTQQLLWQRQQEFETLAENLPDLVARYDAGRRIVYVNAALEAQLGKPRSELIGRTQREVGLPENIIALYDDSLAQVFAAARPHSVEFHVETGSGVRHFEAMHVPECDAAGRVATVICVARDITRRKQVERELHDSRERLAWILGETGVGTWMNRLPLDRLNWDSRTRELFFVPEDVEPTVQWFWQRLHPEDREPTRLAVEAALRSGELYVIDHRVVNPATGEARWLRSTGKASYAPDGTPILFDGINYDITDRKQKEEERLLRAARQRDALIREVHHRIKNSLQGVVGLLSHRARKNPALAAALEETIGQLQSVALVYGLQETRPDGLLNLGRILDAVIASAEDLVGGRVDRTIERRSRRPACIAGGEAVACAFALNELVFNALKHQRAAAGRKRARVSLREMTGVAEIRIRNRGRLPKGFDFSTGRGAGSGLGLVRTLLAAPGAAVTFNAGRGEVEVVLELRPPLLVTQRAMRAWRHGNGIAGEEGGTVPPAGG